MSLSFFIEYFDKSPVTFVLSILVFLFTLLSFWKKKLVFILILHPFSVIHNREYYRILTADLVNADLMHLLLNEFMLYVFCSDLEETLRKNSAYGSQQFFAIYLFSLLFASAVVIARHFRDFDYSTTGTSGSIMGCMFGFMLMDPNYIVYNFTEGSGIKAIYGGLFYIVMLIGYQRKKGASLVNHEYHFYGALGGLMMTIVLHPEILTGIRGLAPYP